MRHRHESKIENGIPVLFPNHKQFAALNNPFVIESHQNIPLPCLALPILTMSHATAQSPAMPKNTIGNAAKN